MAAMFIPRHDGCVRWLRLAIAGCLLVPAAAWAGHEPAEAQQPLSPVEAGVPAACPTDPQDWSPVVGDADWDTSSVCVLELPSCPESRLWSGQHMALSVEYPDFCEETVNRAADRTLFNQCRAETGIAVMVSGRGSSRNCRLVQIPKCPAGLHRITTEDCRGVQRRPWSCAAGSFHRNEFNTCYRPPAAYTTPDHPACGPGAPDFPVGGCESYAGQDFVRSPASLACSTFDTGSASTQMQTEPANNYWCRYDSSLMDLRCHGSGASCTAAAALCLKRASRTGGCDAAAAVISCRAVQAEVRDGTLTAADAVNAGCAPCVDLPFDPTPTQCPGSYLNAPSAMSWDHQIVHRVREDFAIDTAECTSVRQGGAMTATCRAQPVCADPPKGHLTWESSHTSGAAVVNAPVVFTVEDTLTRYVDVEYLRYRWRSAPQSALNVSTRRMMEYPSEHVPARVWGRTSASGTSGSVSQLVQSGECVVRDWPHFRAVVEELWPDDPAHYQEILRLFGADSLDWWDALKQGTNTDAQRAITEVRGIDWWPDLTTDTERDQRNDQLTQKMNCASGGDIWCRWTPKRHGYYRVKAAGAWVVRMYAARYDIDPFWDINGYFDTLRDILSTPAGRSRVNGYLTHLGLSPAAVGLTADLSDLLPLPPNPDEWAYNHLGADSASCLGSDVRFICLTSSQGANYTETEYIGIAVHEIRVATVAPDG